MHTYLSQPWSRITCQFKPMSKVSWKAVAKYLLPAKPRKSCRCYYSIPQDHRSVTTQHIQSIPLQSCNEYIIGPQSTLLNTFVFITGLTVYILEVSVLLCCGAWNLQPNSNILRCISMRKTRLFCRDHFPGVCTFGENSLTRGKSCGLSSFFK